MKDQFLSVTFRRSQNGAGLSFSIANHEPEHWSFFQKLAAADQDQLAGPPKASNTFLQDDDPSQPQVKLSQTQSMQFLKNMPFADVVFLFAQFDACRKR